MTAGTAGECAHHAGGIEVKGEDRLVNRAAPGVSYFTPLQDPPAGTALAMKDGSDNIPKLFTPIKIRGVQLQNRIMVRVYSLAPFHPIWANMFVSSSPLSANTQQ